MNAVAVSVILYVAFQFAVGIWVSRRIKSEADYLLAGRQLGTGLAAFSVFATWFGAETVLGSGGRVFQDGLTGAQGEPFAYALAIILMGLFLAGPLWRRGVTTFADIFRERFSPGVERLTVLMLVPGSVIWAAAQIRGFGHVVTDTSGLPLNLAMTIAAVTVVVYTMFGGLLADVYTDFVQGLAIIAGLLLVLVAALMQVGGVGAAVAAVDTAKLTMVKPDQSVLALLEQWAIPVCGSLVAVELISRVLACRTGQVARRATLIGGLLYFMIALIPVALGLFAGKLVPAGTEAEQVMLVLAKTHLPLVIYAMFAGALVSAILSSVDSALLAASALLSHNFVQRLVPGLSEARKVILTRACVAAFGAIAYVYALRSDSISEIVELASAFATAGIFVVMLFGMFTSFGGPLAAYGALVCGALVWLVGRAALGLTAPYVAGLAAAVLVYVALGAVERARAKA